MPVSKFSISLQPGIVAAVALRGTGTGRGWK